MLKLFQLNMHSVRWLTNALPSQHRFIFDVLHADRDFPILFLAYTYLLYFGIEIDHV